MEYYDYTFIDEFQISDLTLCDSLLQLYNDAHDRGMTFAGQSGAMGQARPEIKASTDFWLNDCDKLGPLRSIGGKSFSRT